MPGRRPRSHALRPGLSAPSGRAPLSCHAARIVDEAEVLEAAARAVVELRAMAARGQLVEPRVQLAQRALPAGVLHELLHGEHVHVERRDRAREPGDIGRLLRVALAARAVGKPAHVPGADARPARARPRRVPREVSFARGARVEGRRGRDPRAPAQAVFAADGVPEQRRERRGSSESALPASRRFLRERRTRGNIPRRPCAAAKVDVRAPRQPARGLYPRCMSSDPVVVPINRDALYERKVRRAKTIVLSLACVVALTLLTALVFAIYGYATERPVKELFLGPQPQ